MFTIILLFIIFAILIFKPNCKGGFLESYLGEPIEHPTITGPYKADLGPYPPTMEPYDPYDCMEVKDNCIKGCYASYNEGTENESLAQCVHMCRAQSVNCYGQSNDVEQTMEMAFT